MMSILPPISSRSAFALVFLAVLSLWGSPVLEVQVSKNPISLRETVELTLVLQDEEAPLSGAPQEIALPPSLPFQVLRKSGPSFQSVSHTVWRNGQTSSQVNRSSATYTYLLKPTRTGDLTIPPVELSYQGKALRSEPLVVQVRDNPAAPSPSELEYDLRLSPGRTVPGVPVTLTLELVHPRQFAIRHLQPTLDLEALGKDFEVEMASPSIPRSGLEWKQEEFTRNGVPCKRTYLELRLTPLHTGTFSLPPSALDLVYEDNRNSRTPFPFLFDDFLGNSLKEETLASSSPTLEVEDFPLAGKPEGFSGLLAPLQVTASVDETTPRVGDPVQLTLRLRGDFLSPPSPLPHWEKALEALPHFKVFGNDPCLPGEDGTLVVRRTLRPLQEGKWEIPPLAIPYYDPQKREYGVATSDPIPLSVQAADEATLPTLPPTTPQGKTPPKAQAARTDTPSPAEAPQGSLLPSRDILLWCLLLPAALLALGGLLKGGLSLRKRYLASPRTQARTARKNLERELDGLDENAPRATAQAARAYETFLCQRLHLTTPITPHSLEEAWNRHNLPAHLLPSFQTLQEHCDAAQYGLLSIPLAQLKEEILDAVQNL